MFGSSGLLLFESLSNLILSSIIIATTNYAGELPSNLIERPGWFDMLLKFDNPDETIRTNLLKFLDQTVSSDIIQATENLSIVALIEIVRQSKIFNTSLIEEIEKFWERCRKAKKDFDKNEQEIVGSQRKIFNRPIIKS